MEKWEKLISILLDESVSDTERDDVAMDLSDYNHKTVANACNVQEIDHRIYMI